MMRGACFEHVSDVEDVSVEKSRQSDRESVTVHSFSSPALIGRSFCEDCECSSCLQHALQDTVTWLSLKEEELDQPLPLGGDVTALQQQRDSHQVS